MKLPSGFKPNGCTAFLEGTHTKCCDLHDIDYALGIDRKLADRKLRDCIRDCREEQYQKEISEDRIKFIKFLIWTKHRVWKVLSVAMYLAVRTFGWYFWQNGAWIREGQPTGDKWWVIGRVKLWLRSKYR